MSKKQKFIVLSIIYYICGIAFPTSSRADDPSEMTCNELWYVRNQIYARNGYCFNTARAKAQFGDGCFPPYGRLVGWEKGYVNTLQMWERRKGC
jgi:hypothetical protein